MLFRLALGKALKLQERGIVLKVRPTRRRASDYLEEGLDLAGENHARLIGSGRRRLREKVRAEKALRYSSRLVPSNGAVSGNLLRAAAVAGTACRLPRS